MGGQPHEESAPGGEPMYLESVKADYQAILGAQVQSIPHLAIVLS